MRRDQRMGVGLTTPSRPAGPGYPSPWGSQGSGLRPGYATLDCPGGLGVCVCHAVAMGWSNTDC